MQREVCDNWECLTMKATLDNSNVVKLMRKIRDQLSLEIMEIPLKKQEEYVSKELKKLKSKYAGQRKL